MSNIAPHKPDQTNWVNVRVGDKLLFRFDPENNLIELRRRDLVIVVRLDDYRNGAQPLTCENRRAKLESNAGWRKGSAAGP